MKKETIRAIVDIIVAENKEIIVLKEEYWNEVIDSKWLESRHKNRHNEIDYRVVHNKLFLYVHKDENDIMASGPWNRRGVNYDNQLNDYIIDMHGILRIGIGWKHNCYTEFPYCVLGAGRMIVGRDGIIHYIDNHSGHYRPTEEEFNNSLKYLDHLTIAHKYVWDYS